MPHLLANSMQLSYFLKKLDFMQLHKTFLCLSESDVISWFYSILRLRTIRKYARAKQKRKIFLSKNSEIVWNIVLPTQASPSKRVVHASKTGVCASKFPCRCKQGKVLCKYTKLPLDFVLKNTISLKLINKKFLL